MFLPLGKASAANILYYTYISLPSAGRGRIAEAEGRGSYQGRSQGRAEMPHEDFELGGRLTGQTDGLPCKDFQEPGGHLQFQPCIAARERAAAPRAIYEATRALVGHDPRPCRTLQCVATPRQKLFRYRALLGST